MTQIGFFDPKSLKCSERRAVIDFVNIDSGQRVKMEITTPEQANTVAALLNNQKEFGLTTTNGVLKKYEGTLALNEHHMTEGLLEPKGHNVSVPVKTLFDVEAGQLPLHSYIMGLGFIADGALRFVRLAMKSLDPNFGVQPPMPAQP